MSVLRKRGDSRSPARARRIGMMVGATALAVATARAEVNYNWEIAANGYWADNAFLQGVGTEEESTLAFEVNPRLRLKQESTRLRSAVDYSFSYITYTEDLGQQQAFHDLSAQSELALVPEWFYLPASVTYAQALIDPARTGAYGAGLLGAGSLSDVATWRTSPRLDRRTSWGSVSAEYTYGEVDYSDRALDSSTDTGAAVIVGIGDPEESIAGRLGYITQKSEYDRAQEFRFDTALAEVAYRLIRDLRLIGQAGVESDIEAAVDQGGLDQSFWRAGIEWKPTRNDEIALSVGRRFFGTTYGASWLRTMRNLEIEVQYTEDPTTQSRQFALQPFDFDISQNRNAGVPGSQGFARLDTDAFLSKQLEGSLRLLGRLTTLVVRLRDEKREYFALDNDDRYSEIAATIERRLGPTLRVSVNANRLRVDLREGVEYDELAYSIRASRTFGRSLTAEAEASRVNRTGGLNEYDATWIRLGVVKRFGEED